MESAGPEDGEAERAFVTWQRRNRPRNQIPATVPVDAVIGARADLIVFICSLSIYTNGISFTTEARARGGPGSDDRPVSLVEGMLGEGFDSDPSVRRVLQDRMLLGVEFADGRRCVSVPRGPEVNPPNEPFLLRIGASGANGVGSAEWFLSPSPPAGDLRVYCAWPSAGIPETTTIISAEVLRQAAGRVQQLWPPARVFDQQPSPSPVVLAQDGWFANFDS